MKVGMETVNKAHLTQLLLFQIHATNQQNHLINFMFFSLLKKKPTLRLKFIGKGASLSHHHQVAALLLVLARTLAVSIEGTGKVE